VVSNLNDLSYFLSKQMRVTQEATSADNLPQSITTAQTYLRRRAGRSATYTPLGDSFKLALIKPSHSSVTSPFCGKGDAIV
jgi:hypothetical protein